MPVKKKQCNIEGESVRTIEEFYSELMRQLPFPPHFGNNLDALWDVLTSDVKGPIEIIWNGAGASRRSMGKDFDLALALLQQVGKERKDFIVIVQE